MIKPTRVHWKKSLSKKVSKVEPGITQMSEQEEMIDLFPTKDLSEMESVTACEQKVNLAII